jgi:thiol-disulfide isomerase/thioredoxin
MKILFETHICFLILICLFSACTKKEGYVISAKIQGKSVEDKKVYLYSDEKSFFYDNGNKRLFLDSTIIRNGRFELKGKVDYPRFYTLVIVKNEKDEKSPYTKMNQPLIPLFLENSDIEITAIADSIQNIKSLFGEQYVYRNIKIKGSRSHDLYMEYKNRKAFFNKKREDLLEEYHTRENGNISGGMDIILRIDKVQQDENQYVKKFIRENSADMAAVYVAEKNWSLFSKQEIDDLLSCFPKNIKETEAGKAMLQAAQEIRRTAVGAQYVDYTFFDIHDKPFALSDCVAQGKYVLLEFWASWCGPGYPDISHLKKIYELYHPEGFEIVSISMDVDKNQWLKAVNEAQTPWLQISDLQGFESEISRIYNFRGIPMSILLSPDGKIITRNMRGLWMERKLIEIYGNKFTR